MDEQTQPTQETIILHAAGSIPGIPGVHGAGAYLVDYEARTATPVADESTPEPEQPQAEPDQEATQPLQAPEQSTEEATPVPVEEATPAEAQPTEETQA